MKKSKKTGHPSRIAKTLAMAVGALSELALVSIIGMSLSSSISLASKGGPCAETLKETSVEKMVEDIRQEKTLEQVENLTQENWQATNLYLTRYKAMEDESGNKIHYVDIQKYFEQDNRGERIKKHLRDSGLPEDLSLYFRPDKDGFAEEDIKVLSNDLLAPNNRYNNRKNAEVVIGILEELVLSEVSSSKVAENILQQGLQKIHSSWLERNEWAIGSYPEQTQDLSADLQITNAAPLFQMLKNVFTSSSSDSHQYLLKAVDNIEKRLNKSRLAHFGQLSIEDAYLSMVYEKGYKIALDPYLEAFFNKKLKKINMASLIDENLDLNQQGQLYSNLLHSEISESLGVSGPLTIQAPTTDPGSGAKVFLIWRGEEFVGALKIQSQEAGGLDELLSARASQEYIKKFRPDLHVSEMADSGLLSDGSYFMIIKPAKTNDLDHWISKNLAKPELVKTILDKAAKTFVDLHGVRDRSSPPSKGILTTFKGNALYDSRKLREFSLNTKFDTFVLGLGLPMTTFAKIKKGVKASVARYEDLLNQSTDKFLPSTIHGDGHGGNVFFDIGGLLTTIIDFGTLTWSLSSKDEPGTGDPANDLGRMMAHLIVEDVRNNVVTTQTFDRAKYLFERYVHHADLSKDSPQYEVLQDSVRFYINRYFAIQLGDIKGKKFKSKVLSHEKLRKNLLKTWEDVQENF